MPRTKRWNKETLEHAVKISVSVRQVLIHLGLVEAGGNYEQIKKYILLYNIDNSHFLGKHANIGKNIYKSPAVEIKKLLIKGSTIQSFKLKKRLFQEKIKKPECELCGWAKESEDGRIPVELDHINGDRNDNRLDNLRILCPNCHSLQLTHRGKNKFRK